MRAAILILLAGIAVSGAHCQRSPGDVCPEPVEYTKEEQKVAADELRALKAEGRAPTIQRFMVDYGEERRRLRAC